VPQQSALNQGTQQHGTPGLKCPSVRTAEAASAGIILPRSSGPNVGHRKAPSSPKTLDTISKGPAATLPHNAISLSVPTRHPSQAPAVAATGTKEAENAAYQERIKAWYTQLLYYRANPETLEFSYMVLANPNSIVYKPYDLVVVSHAKIQRNFYYTMSAEGVMHFNGNETSHVSLEDFERSFFLYKQVSQMQFFAQFRLWKAFRLWRACICRNKAYKASQTLSKRLFYLHKFFGPCLQALVRTCGELDASTTFHIVAAAQPSELERFRVRNHFLASSFKIADSLIYAKKWLFFLVHISCRVAGLRNAQEQSVTCTDLP
jgi:hypothetical protein